MKVTKWSTHPGDTNVSDQQSSISGDTGASTGASASDMSVSAVAGTDAEAVRLSPDQEATSPKADAPKAEATMVEPPKVEQPKVEAATPEAPRIPGKLIVMPPGERIGAGARIDADPATPVSGKRRMSAMAAVVALAAVAGTLGGALATVAVGKMTSAETTAARDITLEASVARIDADIVALKANLEQTSKQGVSQFNKASDRLDKVEKAQTEPAAKLARLSETVDKLRAAQASVAAAPAPAREVTGSVPQQVAAAAPAHVAAAPANSSVAPPKTEVARLPTVEGWVLRDVANGSALIEGRRGMYEVYTGDPVPGLGRVDAIRKQDGRWVVVTSKGLIVSR
jgi:hypothetical protein